MIPLPREMNATGGEMGSKHSPAVNRLSTRFPVIFSESLRMRRGRIRVQQGQWWDYEGEKKVR